VWGFTFLAYMLSIRHKEMRYLLPLVIPVAILAGVGLAEITRWISRQSPAVRAAGVLLLVSGAVIQYGPPLQKLTEPWADPSRTEPWGRSTWEAVQIGSYLKGVSTPADTVYAVHNFPVLAFYSERKTVSLLPIQEHFEQAWRNAMREPGYFVAYEPAGIIETHACPSEEPLFLFGRIPEHLHGVRIVWARRFRACNSPRAAAMRPTRLSCQYRRIFQSFRLQRLVRFVSTWTRP
jgi:hypothetical protein